ncbi:MAG: hypothetical protein ACFFDN_41495 [Candidatus Hodarchaeota archaeon]
MDTDSGKKNHTAHKGIEKMGKKLKQYETVIKVMEENGGFATLANLYQNVLKVPGCEWKSKTPFASIRRIVQDERYFFKIRPGLWALKSHANKVKKLFNIETENELEEQKFTHSYFQGLLVELGNLKNFITYVPSQDKNKNFLNKKLKELIGIESIFRFSYEDFVDRASTIDVIWFNERKMPNAFFEVEHTTDIQNSLIKFVDLQDFYTKYYIVADIARKSEFHKKINYNVFKGIKNRVEFLGYDDLSLLHAKTFELHELSSRINI